MKNMLDQLDLPNTPSISVSLQQTSVITAETQM